VTPEEAEKICREKEMKLAVFETEEEMKLIWAKRPNER
jgi:hypothetical protein